MRTTRLACFLALPLLAVPGAVLAQGQADPLQARFSGSYSETRLGLVVAALNDATHLNLVVDPAVDTDGITITATASEMPAGKFLEQVQQQAGLARTAWCGALVLHRPGQGPGQAPSLPTSAKLDAHVSVDFGGTPFLFAVERLRSRADLEVDLTARARASVQARAASVTLQAYRMQVKHVLVHLARAAGLEWTLQGERVVLDATGEAGRTVDAGEVVLQGTADEMGPRLDVAKLLSELGTVGGRDTARRLLVAAGKQVAGPVANTLADADPPTAIAALQVLQRVGDAAQGDAVLAVFRDVDRSLDVRTEAGVTLGALKATGAVPALIDALDDEWFRVAETARAALTELGAPVVGPLAARYRPAAARPQGQDGIVYRSLLIFGSIGDERSKQLLLEALKTTHGPRAVSMRHHAAIGLGFTQDPKMIEPLIAALERERQFQVASYIARSLTWITDVELPPQPGRWRAWWVVNRDRFLAPKDDDLYDPVELPTDADGLPLLGPGDK